MIFKESLRQRVIPSAGEELASLLFSKTGNRQSAANSRSASSPPVVCKLLNTIIREDVTEHLYNHLMLYENQHGLISNRSNSTNFLEFFDDVTRMLDEGESVNIVYREFYKTFDKVIYRCVA